MKIFTQQDESIINIINENGYYETDNSGVNPERLSTYKTFLEYYKEKHEIQQAKGLIFGLYCFEGNDFKSIEDYRYCITNSVFESGIQLHICDNKKVILELEVPDEIVHKTDFGYFSDFLYFLEEEGDLHLEYTDTIGIDKDYGTYLGQAVFYKIEKDWILNIYTE